MFLEFRAERSSVRADFPTINYCPWLLLTSSLAAATRDFLAGRRDRSSRRIIPLDRFDVLRVESVRSTDRYLTIFIVQVEVPSRSFLGTIGVRLARDTRFAAIDDEGSRVGSDRSG